MDKYKVKAKNIKLKKCIFLKTVDGIEKVIKVNNLSNVIFVSTIDYNGVEQENKFNDWDDLELLCN